MRPVDTERRRAITLVYLVGALLLLWLARSVLTAERAPRSVSWSELAALVDAGRVIEAQVAEHTIAASLRAEGASGDAAATVVERVVATRLPEVDEGPLVTAMREHQVTVRGEIEQTSWWEPLLFGWVLPLLFLGGLWWLIMRRVAQREGPLSVGKSQAKIYDRNREDRVTFQDVAGVDEAKGELIEIVDFLKDPAKHRALGARAPKGVLLVGPPGTGKTLLARAVAGEAGVPFFSMSGSEFVQMFVGVGAARVRDLFEQAKGRAPCIVFIDELDAIGRSRAGASVGAMVHEEREQTLNQLLVEMDGFDAGSGVVILAATNRPEILDRALMRAGRFDRQVIVDRPDVRGREAILGVHARKVKLAKNVDLKIVAQRTPGMAGADLANVVNEAALAATRRKATEIEMRDFEEAVDRIQLGLKKQGRVMTQEERRRVAYHESGHALVAMSVEHADPVHRVTIIPRSIGALGVTLQLPTEERYLLTKGELLDRIAVMLGGRCAEELVCHDVSTGAQNDLERATETARAMIMRFGMGKSLGLMSAGAPESRFLDVPDLAPRTYSEETARAIDVEVRELLEAQRERATKILEARRAILDRMVARLLEVETIDHAELKDLIAS
ncbi:MAG: ATP-dependent zinc metalloprotease FtsH [Sandaracinaceae bacterium]